MAASLFPSVLVSDSETRTDHPGDTLRWPRTVTVQRRLKERRGAPKCGSSEFVDRVRQINEAASCTLPEYAQYACNRQASIGGNKTNGPLIDDDEVGLDRLGQMNCRALACLEFFHTGRDYVRGMFDGDPAGQTCSPGSNCSRRVRVQQFKNDGMRHNYLAEKLPEQIDLPDQDKVRLSTAARYGMCSISTLPHFSLRYSATSRR